LGKGFLSSFVCVCLTNHFCRQTHKPLDNQVVGPNHAHVLRRPPRRPSSGAAVALNPFTGSGGNVRYWQEDELVDLVNAVGLTGYERVALLHHVHGAQAVLSGGGMYIA
jgi:hypothetical protein